MKKLMLAIIALTMLACGAAALGRPAMAASCGGINTALIDCSSGGNGVVNVACLVISIMVVGVGILAAIGLVIAGIQYLTSRDNAAQVQKAKRRILYVVIGLAVYAAAVPVTNFLLPGGMFGCTSGGGTVQNEQSSRGGGFGEGGGFGGSGSGGNATGGSTDRPASEFSP